jgi:hypothetical protein
MAADSDTKKFLDEVKKGKPPTKDLTLKGFLAEEAGMKFRPTYELVDQLPAINEADDEQDSDEAEQQGTAAAAQAPADSAAPPEVDLAELWKERATSLAANLKLLKQAQIDDEIDRKIQDSIDAGAADFTAAVSEIRAARQQVQSHELIRHLETHPTLRQMGVEAAFMQALDDLELHLSS